MVCFLQTVRNQIRWVFLIFACTGTIELIKMALTIMRFHDFYTDYFSLLQGKEQERLKKVLDINNHDFMYSTSRALNRMSGGCGVDASDLLCPVEPLIC